MVNMDVLYDKEIDFLKERILTQFREVEGTTPAERATRFFQGKPGKVPIGFILADEWSAHYRGFTTSEVATEAKKLVVSHLNLCARFNMDLWCMTWPHLYLIIPAAVGTKLLFPEDSTPMVSEPIVKKPSDVEKLEVPDMRSSGQMPYYWETYRIMKERLSDIYPVEAGINTGNCGHPFDFASQLRGTSQIFIDTKTNPQLVKKLCDFSADCIIEVGKIAKKDFGLTNFFMAGAAVGKLSAKDFFEFDFPATLKIKKALEPYGIKVSCFIFKDPKIVEAIYDAGMTFLGLPMPVIFSTNYWSPEKGWFPSDEDLIRDHQEAKSKGWPIFVLFLGHWLQATSPRRIEQHIRHTVEILGPSTPILPTVLPRGTPIENVDAFVQAMRKYAVSE